MRGDHTLSHEIFQVMPFDVVRQIADIDATVLLGRVANALHHRLFAGWVYRPRRGSTTSCVRLVASCAATTNGGSRATVVAAIVVATAGATARGVGAPRSTGRARAAARRAVTAWVALLVCVSFVRHGRNKQQSAETMKRGAGREGAGVKRSGRRGQRELMDSACGLEVGSRRDRGRGGAWRSRLGQSSRLGVAGSRAGAVGALSCCLALGVKLDLDCGLATTRAGTVREGIWGAGQDRDCQESKEKCTYGSGPVGVSVGVLESSQRDGQTSKGSRVDGGGAVVR